MVEKSKPQTKGQDIYPLMQGCWYLFQSFASRFHTHPHSAMRLFDLVVALLHVELVELGLVVAIDAAVSRARHGVDGALALLESAGRDLGGVPLIAHPPIALG